MKAAASAAGVSQSEWMRARLLEVRPVAGLLERTDLPGAGAVVELTAEQRRRNAEFVSADRMPDRRDPEAWWCPEPLCQKRMLDKGARCPVHGSAMTMKGSG